MPVTINQFRYETVKMLRAKHPNAGSNDETRRPPACRKVKSRFGFVHLPYFCGPDKAVDL
jgi:hypothetical protein